MANAKTEERKKAEELIHKFIETIPVGIPFNRAWEIAKKCAIKAVDEFLNEIKTKTLKGINHPIYKDWQEVKQEIEKL